MFFLVWFDLASLIIFNRRDGSASGPSIWRSSVNRSTAMGEAIPDPSKRLLWLGGFAGSALGSGRTRLACGPLRACWSLRACWPLRAHGSLRACCPWRTGRSCDAAVLYQHLSLVGTRGYLDNAGGRKFCSDPPEPSSRSALNLHCLAWINFNLHAGLARSPDSSDNCQLAARYGGSRDEYFCAGFCAPWGHTDS